MAKTSRRKKEKGSSSESSRTRSRRRNRERRKAEKQGFDEIARKAGITKGSKDPEPDMQEKAA